MTIASPHREKKCAPQLALAGLRSCLPVPAGLLLGEQALLLILLRGLMGQDLWGVWCLFRFIQSLSTAEVGVYAALCWPVLIPHHTPQSAGD